MKTCLTDKGETQWRSPRKISARFHFNCNTMQCDVRRACLLREFSSASRSLQYIVVRTFFVHVFLRVLACFINFHFYLLYTIPHQSFQAWMVYSTQRAACLFYFLGLGSVIFMWTKRPTCNGFRCFVACEVKNLTRFEGVVTVLFFC